MAYADFTLEAAEAAFDLTVRPTTLFPGLIPEPAPVWLQEQLERGHRSAALVSEKARSEFIVAPVLMAVSEMAGGALSIYSGQRLDVDPSRGLVGECDYVLALSPPVPRLRAPIAIIVEAKKGDVEAALGQCVAQLVAARVFNERAKETDRPMFGCVTSGDVWQFLRLTRENVDLDENRFFVDNIGGILAAMRTIIAAAGVMVNGRTHATA